ncbi:Dynein heavy chain-like protein [Liparis tanakae]|uniref:Dynein heavy chain-like protein n=1 Tax=Liparis tanakae TaxID=230148 RepID=A0A4Z2F7N8_9TELE|nr:Dynein heavy chain-like protein [Liparis tanakae]
MNALVALFLSFVYPFLYPMWRLRYLHNRGRNLLLAAAQMCAIRVQCTEFCRFCQCHALSTQTPTKVLMASSANATGGPTSLPADLEKLRAMLLSDLKSKIQEALAPLADSNNKLRETMEDHGRRVTGIGEDLSGYSDRIVDLEEMCTSLKNTNSILVDTVDDLENRSRKCNLRVTNLAEKIEGTDPICGDTSRPLKVKHVPETTTREEEEPETTTREEEEPETTTREEEEPETTTREEEEPETTTREEEEPETTTREEEEPETTTREEEEPEMTTREEEEPETTTREEEEPETTTREEEGSLAAHLLPVTSSRGSSSTHHRMAFHIRVFDLCIWRFPVG